MILDNTATDQPSPVPISFLVVKTGSDHRSCHVRNSLAPVGYQNDSTISGLLYPDSSRRPIEEASTTSLHSRNPDSGIANACLLVYIARVPQHRRPGAPRLLRANIVVASSQVESARIFVENSGNYAPAPDSQKPWDTAQNRGAE